MLLEPTLAVPMVFAPTVCAPVVLGPEVPGPMPAELVLASVALAPVVPVALVVPPEPFEAASGSESDLLSPQAVAANQINPPAPTPAAETS